MYKANVSPSGALPKHENTGENPYKWVVYGIHFPRLGIWHYIRGLAQERTPTSFYQSFGVFFEYILMASTMFENKTNF